MFAGRDADRPHSAAEASGAEGISALVPITVPVRLSATPRLVSTTCKGRPAAAN